MTGNGNNRREITHKEKPDNRQDARGLKRVVLVGKTLSHILFTSEKIRTCLINQSRTLTKPGSVYCL